MPSILQTEEIDALARQLRIEPHPIRRLRTRYFKQQWSAADALAEIPEDLRESFASQVEFQHLQLDQRHDSQLDGASKLLFQTQDGYRIESVILRVMTGRTSLCISSQIGCAANCDFCATGKMGIAKQLTSVQILDQIVQANQILLKEDRKVRNIVFMGMGEPLHNEDEVSAAIAQLIDPYGFAHTPRRVLVSTVGIPDAMIRFANRFPQVNMALSLHSAVQATRESIIPLAAKHSLAEIRAALVEIDKLQKQPLMIEYLMLHGVNDSEAECDALHEFLKGLKVHINLIPYNAIEDAPHLTGTAKAGQESFSTRLKQLGHTVTIRYSLGADIAAACGQLVRGENRKIAADRRELISLERSEAENAK
ncbi:MAG: radical SAM protein [Blastopirellula sp.]|nr:MAG: radical SAM protein [Blastopirellula sp.]